MANKTKIIVAYLAGQATQVLIHAMCLNNNMYSYKQIPFCIAAGFVIFFALVMGIQIANGELVQPETKSYAEHLKVEESKVARVSRMLNGFTHGRDIDDLDECDELPEEIKVTNSSITKEQK